MPTLDFRALVAGILVATLGGAFSTLVIVLPAGSVFFSSTGVLAGAGDENYNGEDGDQPADGISPGPGLPQDAPDTGDRTRAKDL